MLGCLVKILIVCSHLNSLGTITLRTRSGRFPVFLAKVWLPGFDRPLFWKSLDQVSDAVADSSPAIRQVTIRCGCVFETPLTCSLDKVLLLCQIEESDEAVKGSGNVECAFGGHAGQFVG
eukprot:818068-Amphidinium_carterae.3